MYKEMVIQTTWTENDWEDFSEWLKSMLRMGPAKVTFTKKDGTERVMNCSLAPTDIPAQVIDENKQYIARKPNPDTMRVFDLDKKEWRSFTIKSVKSVNISLV